MKALITVGVSASGKTHFVNQFLKSVDSDQWVNLNRDDYRKKLLTKIHGDHYNPETTNMWSLWKHNKHNESIVNEMIKDDRVKAFEEGKNIILSDTNLNQDKLDKMIEALEFYNYEVEIKVFHENYETLVKRDAMRLDSVGGIVIGKQLSTFYKMKIWQDMNVDIMDSHCNTNHSAILVDLDGTIAHMINRSPFEWDLVDTDVFDYIVWNAVRGISEIYDSTVIFVSGRDGSCYDKTYTWLNDHIDNDNYPFELRMRTAGDMRSDDIVKREILADIVQDYKIEAIFDDRPKVARMFRSLGFKVFQLGDPYAEF